MQEKTEVELAGADAQHEAIVTRGAKGSEPLR